MESTEVVPLVVDLDGTLTPTDTLIESLIQLIKRKPLSLLKLPFWIFKGRAAFKDKVASSTALSLENYPFREILLEYLRGEKEKGRRLILATATHKSIAESISMRLGIFDKVLASDERLNLKGKVKLQAIQDEVGTEFVYAGDSRADIPIWLAARAAILVGVSPSVGRVIKQKIPVEFEIEKDPFRFSTWLRALRVHQWSKNLLLFVPLLTAFSFIDVVKLTTIVIAFFAFSLIASATYIVNDLWDLENDRVHPRKRLRPLASARISIIQGIIAAGISLSFGFFLAQMVSLNFFLILLLYLVLTSSYSWVLKEHVIVDVIMLSVLYTLRIYAGSVAIEVTISFWLLAFSIFVFFSLALVKRCAELVSLGQNASVAMRGRAYRVTDLVVLWPLGVGAALSAMVVFGLFISASETQERYATPDMLWLVVIALVYWLSRLWIKTSRGEMHDDPVVYAMKDNVSRITIMVMIIIMTVAYFFDWESVI